MPVLSCFNALGGTSGAGTAHQSEAHEFHPPVFSGVRIAQSLV